MGHVSTLGFLFQNSGHAASRISDFAPVEELQALVAALGGSVSFEWQPLETFSYHMMVPLFGWQSWFKYCSFFIGVTAIVSIISRVLHKPRPRIKSWFNYVQLQCGALQL